MGQQSNISSDRTQQQVEPSIYKKRTVEALKQLFCGGIAGSVAKTVTAPLSRLTILFQVHSMVTTRSDRPKFSMTLGGGMSKIIERGGIRSMWRGNMTSVLHRFPYSAINFFVYENILDELTGMRADHKEKTETDTLASHKFLAGAMAGICAVSACYPLDLVKTRLTTQFEGAEYYSGIRDAFRKIYKHEGFMGFYSGIGPTLLVAVPNFAISYSVYGTLKEYTLDDDLFYNLRKVDAESGDIKSGFLLTVLCGACSGCFATIITFPMDTIRRRMQIQNLHVDLEHRLTSRQQLMRLVKDEGLGSLYRGLKPELLKVIPMVSTMFLVYESSKDLLNVEHNR
ncbi:mitochondrial carrier [Fragilariopsis cylindrus CCMP1102]|uniref:Mitochondrial carrier n=1 Tax=Fragilariopsis cylindrus CCMP1102 TaxID=635003 RepID=A0A1E7FKB1_9STRA|nr:mitochondrial carrier [Fragilariopsis cylindrus CCMP1102]|eukprot:OEU18596.1 mitochondrial carrier [Fragilariopsis cylindrus CCMP1102]